jgi:hypothetical protein
MGEIKISMRRKQKKEKGAKKIKTTLNFVQASGIRTWKI